MPAKKKVVDPKMEGKTCGKAHNCIGGIIAIILGLCVGVGWLTLEYFFGIVFVLMGLKKLFGYKC